MEIALDGTYSVDLVGDSPALGTLTIGAASGSPTLRVNGLNLTVAGEVTVTSGAVLSLTSSALAATSLTIAPGAALNTAGTQTTIQAALDNQGTITADGPEGLAIDGPDGVHTNSGAITANSGFFVVVNKIGRAHV